MARASSAQRVPAMDGLAAVFAAELDEQLHAALAAWPRASAPVTRPDAFRDLSRIFHTIKGGAGLVGRSELATAALTLERFFADPDAASAPEQSVVDAVFGAASLPPPALASLLQGLLDAGSAPTAPAQVVPVAVGEMWLALPLSVIERAMSITTPEASLPIVVEDRPLAALRLADLVGAPPPPTRAVALVLRNGGALVVDRVRPPVSLVVEPLGRLLALHPWLAGATVDPRGRAVGVLDAERLLGAFAARSAGAAEAGADDARRVLVVDDSLVAREAATAALRAAGVTFDVARDGREALAKLERGHYAVVLSDLEMPHLDGFGLVERLRANSRLRDQPVVVCSSRLDDDARQRLSPFAVDGFVDKPFIAGDLLAALRPWLATNAEQIV